MEQQHKTKDELIAEAKKTLAEAEQAGKQEWLKGYQEYCQKTGKELVIARVIVDANQMPKFFFDVASIKK